MLLTFKLLIRCVVVNLRVKTTGTGLLGLDGHVCEVLLILRAFSELMVSRNKPQPIPTITSME